MKKKILGILAIAIIFIIMSIVTAYATSYLYNSSEVYYDNTNSNLTSSDVQGAIDELYTEATNYSNMNTRVTNIENDYATSSNIAYKLYSGSSRNVLYAGDTVGDVTFSTDISNYKYIIIWYFVNANSTLPIMFKTYVTEVPALLNGYILLDGAQYSQSDNSIFHSYARYKLSSTGLEIKDFIRFTNETSGMYMYTTYNQLHITYVVGYK